jgi:hypothetical protein
MSQTRARYNTNAYFHSANVNSEHAQSFLADAWSSYRPSHGSLAEWARNAAHTYYYSIHGVTKFVKIYTHFLAFAQAQPVRTARKKMALDPADLKAYAKNAWNGFSHELCTVQEWSRINARTYYHKLKGDVPFLTLYNKFLNYAKHHAKNVPHAPARPAAPQRTTFAKDGECTDAEFSQGRSELNAFLNQEYSTWWDALVAEAEEDTSCDMSATDRFADLCGKYLSAKSGIPQEDVEAVVKAWLLERSA